MGSNYKLSYAVDLVFCIDATESMDHIIDTVKSNALNFYGDFQAAMAAKHKNVSSVRIKVIAFRDYLADGRQAMMMSDFFTLPAQAADFRDCVNSIEAKGGGDDPEDSFEAIAYAIKSDWNSNADRKRHVIVVWSDDDAHDIGFGKKSKYYPNGRAKDFDELTRWWGSRLQAGLMDENAKRLLLFVPGMKNWTKLRNTWNNVIHFESEAGDGLENCDYDSILNTITNSI